MDYNISDVKDLKGLGAYLKKVREQANISILEIQKETKIRSKYITAMENGNFSAIPGGNVYVQGFLKNYANSVGLKSNTIIKQYKKICKPIKEKAPINSIHRRTTELDTLLGGFIDFIRRNYKKICSIFLTVVFIIIVTGLVGIIKNKKQLQEALPIPQMPIEDNSLENEINMSPIEKKVPEMKEIEVMIEIIEDTAQNTIYLIDADFINISINNITDRCWILVYQDNNQVFEGILNVGEKRSWKAENNVSIRIGNPTAVNLTVNDRDLGDLTGEARNFIFKRRI